MAVLCRYRYDALDRLASCEAEEQPSAQEFYLKNRLAVEIQGQVQRRIFQHDDLLLAQGRCEGDSSRTALLLTDRQQSVLHVLEGQVQQPMVYTPYGHRAVSSGIAHLPGFNGERLDPVTGHYLLGSGYRAFNPLLMRFNSPDSSSPFGDGGLNAYAYCVGDPVNRVDPTGHIWTEIKPLWQTTGPMNKRELGSEFKIPRERIQPTIPGTSASNAGPAYSTDFAMHKTIDPTSSRTETSNKYANGQSNTKPYLQRYKKTEKGFDLALRDINDRRLPTIAESNETYGHRVLALSTLPTMSTASTLPLHPNPPSLPSRAEHNSRNANNVQQLTLVIRTNELATNKEGPSLRPPLTLPR
jgi:RHS repeat-associated protein